MPIRGRKCLKQPIELSQDANSILDSRLHRFDIHFYPVQTDHDAAEPSVLSGKG